MKIGYYVKLAPNSVKDSDHYGKIKQFLVASDGTLCVAYNAPVESSVLTCPYAANLRYKVVSKVLQETTIIADVDRIYRRVKILDWDSTSFLIIDY
jgi:hypothetical protein